MHWAVCSHPVVSGSFPKPSTPGDSLGPDKIYGVRREGRGAFNRFVFQE